MVRIYILIGVVLLFLVIYLMSRSGSIYDGVSNVKIDATRERAEKFCENYDLPPLQKKELTDSVDELMRK